MKSAEVPKPVLIGIVTVLLLIIGFVFYNSMLKPPVQVDATKVPAQRLLDPDPRGASATGE